MDQRQVQVRLAEEMNHILSDTAIAPVIEDGRVVGCSDARAGGQPAHRRRAARRRRLTRVNDTTIDGMATLIALWPRLQNATELRAVVLRGGQPVSFRVTLR